MPRACTARLGNGDKLKKVLTTVVLASGILLSSILPMAGQEASTPSSEEASNFVFLPLVQSNKKVELTEVEVGWLDVTSVNAAEASAVCGNELPTFSETATAADANDDVCLLPGNYPVAMVKINDAYQGYNLGGWSGDSRKAWKLSSGSLGSKTTKTDVTTILKAWPQYRNVAKLDEGNVTVIKLGDFFTDATVTGASVEEVLASDQFKIFDFMSDIMGYIKEYGTSKLTSTAPSSQLFVNSLGVPGLYPAMCGVGAEGVPIIVIGPTTFGSGPLPNLAIQVVFLNPTVATCMGDYKFIKISELMRQPAYEPIRVELRAKGYNAWESFVNWEILRPSPEVIYVLSWTATTGAAIYSVSKYVVTTGGTAALNGAASFLIIPEKFLNCPSGNFEVCYAEPIQSR